MGYSSAQQQPKTQFHGEGLIVAAPFCLDLVTELPQLLPHDLLLAVELPGQEDGHGH
jgi:hypothetical protein